MTQFLDLEGEYGDGTFFADWGRLLTRLEAVTGALEGMAVTSASEVTPAEGELAFVADQTATERPLAVGATVRGKSASDPAAFFVGTVVSFAGNALAIDATIAAGGDPVTDWVIGYEAAYQIQIVLDAAPKLGADLDGNGKSITALLALALTGNLTVGGTAAVTGAATFSDDATIAGLLTVSSVEGAFDPIGDVSGTATVTAAPQSSLRLTGDTTITLTAATASTLAVRMLTITNSGGYVPTFTGADYVGDVDPPDWAAQGTQVTDVGWYYTGDGRLKWYVIQEDAA